MDNQTLHSDGSNCMCGQTFLQRQQKIPIDFYLNECTYVLYFCVSEVVKLFYEGMKEKKYKIEYTGQQSIEK